MPTPRIGPTAGNQPHRHGAENAANGAAGQGTGDRPLRRLRLMTGWLVEKSRVRAAGRHADLLRPKAGATQIRDGALRLFAIREDPYCGTW